MIFRFQNMLFLIILPNIEKKVSNDKIGQGSLIQMHDFDENPIYM